jgi:hypothetical protein
MFRVIWQYQPQAIGDFGSPSVLSPVAIAPATHSLFADLPLLGSVEPVFRGPAVKLRAASLAATPQVVAEPLHDLAGFMHAFVPDLETAKRLQDRLLADGEVLTAEIQPPLSPAFRLSRDAPPPGPISIASLNPLPTPDLSPYQGYLDAAPRGIHAGAAWALAGGRGAGVSVIDIESGWNFLHEDLRQVQGGVVYGAASDDDHGTAVLGIFSGDRNGLGIEGICPEAVAKAAAATAVYEIDPLTGKELVKWNAAAAIQAAAQLLRPGDVILLEMHGPGPNSAPGTAADQVGFVPVEYWRAERAAIAYATACGIHVVEAAGNGGENLDASVYQGTFDRSRFDSGAILVGGGAAAAGAMARSRMSWSNYGSRLDVQGWGESIVTTGGRSAWYYYNLVSDQDPGRCYTQSFGGTSGASPIVVGAVACLAGIVAAAGRPGLTTAEMRQLLGVSGTAQADSATAPAAGEPIGPLPNLAAALAALGLP